MRSKPIRTDSSASGTPVENLTASGGRQRLQHAARRGPGRMDALAAQDFDNALPELPQPDAAAREVRLHLQQAEDVALGRVRIEAQQQIGRGQMEEAQGMRLQDLPVVHQAAQQRRHRRDLDAEQGVAGLGARQHVAHGADAADARHQRRHLVERPAFADLLEAPKLHHVELRRIHLPAVVQVDGDLGVAFDTSYWRNQNPVRHAFIRTCGRRCGARVRRVGP